MLYNITAVVTSFRVDDTEIDAIIDGTGDAIVLIAGFPLTREIWNEPAAQLAQSHRIIRPDLRGMGSSRVPDGPYLMEILAGDIAAMLDALSIEKAGIAGHSLGGYVALAFARMYSERVNKLALVCSRLGADSPGIAGSRNDLADRLEREDSIEPALDAYLPRLFSDATIRSNAQLFDRARDIGRRNSARGAAAMLRGMAQRADSNDIAPELGMPVLIVAGKDDKVVPLEEAQRMQRAFPAAQIRIMERSGHLPMLEEPAALTAVLSGFFESP